MRKRYLFLAYVVIELAAFIAMVMTLGFGSAVLIWLVVAGLGLVMLQWQGRKVFAELGRAARNEVEPTGALADTAALAASTALLIVPGVVTSVLGVVLLIPGARRLARPLIVAVGTQRVAMTMQSAGFYASGVRRGGTVIDGTVVDAEYDVFTPDIGQLPRGR